MDGLAELFNSSYSTLQQGHVVKVAKITGSLVTVADSYSILVQSVGLY